MAFVGIDQSYTGFGLVILHANTLEPHAHLGRFEAVKHGDGVARLVAIENWLLEQLSGWDVDAIVMEGYSRGAKFGREQSGELAAHVRRALAVDHPQALSPVVAPPTSVKKFATGTGAAKKAEMLLAVYKRWGVEFKDDNLADAYTMARMAHALNNPEHPITAFQREVLANLN